MSRGLRSEAQSLGGLGACKNLTRDVIPSLSINQMDHHAEEAT